MKKKLKELDRVRCENIAILTRLEEMKKINFLLRRKVVEKDLELKGSKIFKKRIKRLKTRHMCLKAKLSRKIKGCKR